MPVTVVKHPLIEHKLGLMRSKNISTKDFRDLSSEAARLLTYEGEHSLFLFFPSASMPKSAPCSFPLDGAGPGTMLLT